jgi:hypothetical protein
LAKLSGWLGIALCSCSFQAGCGLYVPEKSLLHSNEVDAKGRSREGKAESNIVANIRCEITKGLYKALATGNVPWLAGWGTAISLNLSWEDQSNVSPGLVYSTPISAVNLFSLNTNASVSAHATRQENITFILENKTLFEEATLRRHVSPELDCSALQNGVTVESDLKIDEFIFDKATIAGGHEARTNPIDYPQFSTFQETLTFIATLSGGVTPNWTLTRFVVNPAGNGSFVGATRTNTSVVIITLGPLATPASPAGPAELAVQATVQHDAALYGALTGSSIVSQTR